MRLIAVISLLLALPLQAATNTAATASRADVQAAVDLSAASGDTVVIPAGDVYWETSVNISNSVTIVGAGTNDLTVWSADTNQAFYLYSSSGGPVSFSGIFFTKSNLTLVTSNPHIRSQAPLTNGIGLWINRCHFRYGSRSIYASRRTYGLINECTAEDQDTWLAIENQVGTDDGAYEWTLPLRIGSTNSMVVEDCRGDFTSVSDGLVVNSFLYGQEGDRITYRYNVFCTTNSTVDASPFDPHGYYPSWGHGSMLYEIYDNDFYLNGVAIQFLPFRGGTMIVYSNNITSVDLTPEGFRTRNEQLQNSGGAQSFNPTNQLANSHVWGNIVNGAPEQSLGHGEPGWFNALPDTNGVVFDGNLGSEWSALYTAPTWSGSGVSYIETSAGVAPSYVQNGGDLYRCISSHTSDASTEPGVGASWAAVWVQDAWHIYTREPQSGDPLFPYTPLAYPYPGLSGGGGEAPPYNTSANINGNVRVRGRVTIGP